MSAGLVVIAVVVLLGSWWSLHNIAKQDRTNCQCPSCRNGES